MSNYDSDPTANAAIGAVDKELRRMRREAAQLRKRREQGRLTRAEELSARRRFRGIYRRLLEEALGGTL